MVAALEAYREEVGARWSTMGGRVAAFAGAALVDGLRLDGPGLDGPGLDGDGALRGPREELLGVAAALLRCGRLDSETAELLLWDAAGRSAGESIGDHGGR